MEFASAFGIKVLQCKEKGLQNREVYNEHLGNHD
jgi:hypothetical protein